MQHPSPFTLDGFLKSLLDGQAVAAKSRVQVEFKREGDVRHYEFSSLDKKSLEASVQQRMDEAEHAEHGGFAQFLTPWKTPDGVWHTRGEVVIFQPTQAAE